MSGQEIRNYIGLAYASYNRVKPQLTGRLDRDVRHPEWTAQLLKQFGNPDRSGYNVMVAGSKGKGSHAILLAAILQRAGLRTGLFTGPHLVDFMERFRINGQAMRESVFCQLMAAVHDAAQSLPIPDNQYIGPVGMLAVIAALWFNQQGTDVNVYECGRGALHDDVNQVYHQGAILTPVFTEHAEQLGPTLEDIAREKFAVASGETSWLVSGSQQPVVRSWLERDLRIPTCHPVVDGTVWVDETPDGIEVCAKHGAIRILLPKSLDYLEENARSALQAAMLVWSHVRPGTPFPAWLDLRDVRLPGRMDVLSLHPYAVVDGTIHGDSARRAAAYVDSLVHDGRISQLGLVLSLPSDKDGLGVLDAFAGRASWLIFTETTNAHLHFDDRWLEAARTLYADVSVIGDVHAAVLAARSRLTTEDGVLFLGTQSFVGDVLRLYGETTCPIWRGKVTAWSGS